ncbi:MAG: tyrosine-protein kinase family protein, partial [Gemmatimonas sp.]
QLAQGGFGRVLLVDAAVRLDGLDDARSRADQSGTSRLDMADFGVSSGMTLSGLLSGSVWTTEPLPSTELQPMYLPAGGVNTPALLSTARLQHFLSNTARHFDWIIVDAGSLGDAGVSQLAQLTDATLVVVDSRRTRRQVVLDALRQLPEGRMGVCGVVLNRQRQYIPDVLYERV